MKSSVRVKTARFLLHLPFPRHNRTAFVKISTALCVACGNCVETCPRQVLGIISLLQHQHVHVDQAAECIGCLKCAATCPQKAIQSRRK